MQTKTSQVIQLWRMCSVRRVARSMLHARLPLISNWGLSYPLAGRDHAHTMSEPLSLPLPFFFASYTSETLMASEIGRSRPAEQPRQLLAATCAAEKLLKVTLARSVEHARLPPPWWPKSPLDASDGRGGGARSRSLQARRQALRAQGGSIAAAQGGGGGAVTGCTATGGLTSMAAACATTGRPHPCRSRRRRVHGKAEAW